MEAASVTAVASPNSADAFIEDNDLDATAFVDVEAMMDTNIDAVDICAPTPTHRPLVEAAAARDLDTFCEKPLALTLEDAAASADAHESTAAVTVFPFGWNASGMQVTISFSRDRRPPRRSQRVA
jgi:predicted dehydrogenase